MEERNRAKVTLSSSGDVTVMSISGEPDHSSCEMILDCFGSIELGTDALVIVDLSKASYLDSEALKAVVFCGRKVATQGGKMAIVCSGAPRRVFAMTRVDQLFPVYPDLDAAIQQLTAFE